MADCECEDQEFVGTEGAFGSERGIDLRQVLKIMKSRNNGDYELWQCKSCGKVYARDAA